MPKKSGIVIDTRTLYLNDECSKIFWADDDEYHNHMLDNHKHVLIKIGVGGPSTRYSLKKEITKTTLFSLGIPKRLVHRLDDTQANRAINDLIELGFIAVLPKTDYAKNEVIGLSFPGLFWYFVYSGFEGTKKRIDKFLEGWEDSAADKKKKERAFSGNYSPMVLCKHWKLIINTFDRCKCLNIITDSLSKYHIKTMPIDIPPLGLKLNSYLADSELHDDLNISFYNFLKNDYAEELRKAYLLFLINSDLNRLNDVNEVTFENTIRELRTVEALERLEAKRVNPYNFFTNDVLIKYLGENSIDYFYTGLCVKNLLEKLK